MALIRRARQGTCFTYQSLFRLVYPISAVCIALGDMCTPGSKETPDPVDQAATKTSLADPRPRTVRGAL
jgi:hypothetical protein